MNLKKILMSVVLLVFLLPVFFIIRADELDDVTKELESLKRDLSGKEANYQELNKRLEDIKKRVVALEGEITKKEIEVKKGEEALIYQQNLLNEKAKSYYKKINKY